MTDTYICTPSKSGPQWTAWDFMRWQYAVITGKGNTELFAFKEAWIKYHREDIIADSSSNKIPALLLGGVAFNEVGGKPDYIGGVALKEVVYDTRVFDRSGPDWITNHLTITRNPELTSFGPLSVQLRRAMETLHIDQTRFSPQDKINLVHCLETDSYNIAVAAEHLRYLVELDNGRDQSNSLTDEQIIIAGARYNQGPDVKLENLKKNLSYGNTIIRHKPQIIRALYGL